MKHALISIAALALASCGNNLNDPITSTEVVQTYQPPAAIMTPALEYADSNTPELYPDVIGLAYYDAREVMQAAGWNPLELGITTDPELTCAEDMCKTYPELKQCDNSPHQICNWTFRHLSGQVLVVSTQGSIKNDDLEVYHVDYLENMDSTFADGTILE